MNIKLYMLLVMDESKQTIGMQKVGTKQSMVGFVGKSHEMMHFSIEQHSVVYSIQLAYIKCHTETGYRTPLGYSVCAPE